MRAVCQAEESFKLCGPSRYDNILLVYLCLEPQKPYIKRLLGTAVTVKPEHQYYRYRVHRQISWWSQVTYRDATYPFASEIRANWEPNSISWQEMSSHNVYALCRSAYVALGARLWKYCKIHDLVSTAPIHIVLNFIEFTVIGALALSYSGFIRPRGAGFYCDDQSIKFPYRGDTISVPQLFLGSLLAPIFFVSLLILHLIRLHNEMSWSLLFPLPDLPCRVLQEMGKVRAPDADPFLLAQRLAGLVAGLEGRASGQPHRPGPDRVLQKPHLGSPAPLLGHLQTQCHTRNVRVRVIRSWWILWELNRALYFYSFPFSVLFPSSIARRLSARARSLMPKSRSPQGTHHSQPLWLYSWW